MAEKVVDVWAAVGNREKSGPPGKFCKMRKYLCNIISRSSVRNGNYVNGKMAVSRALFQAE